MPYVLGRGACCHGVKRTSAIAILWLLAVAIPLVPPAIAAPTALIKDINSGTVNSNPTLFTAVNGKLVFSATTAAEGTELWQTDGTGAGTSIVSNINTGTNSSTPGSFCVLGTTAYFRATDATHGAELWKTNGTSTGTSLVYDYQTGGGSSNPNYITAIDNFVIFAAIENNTIRTELYYYHPVLAMQGLYVDIHPNNNQNGNPANLLKIGDWIYFAGTSQTNGRELWKVSNTGISATQVRNINPGNNLSSNPANFIDFAGKLLFTANDGTYGEELWISDGSSAGTTIVRNINPGNAASAPVNLTAVGSMAFFSATDGTNGVELWVTNGTSAGTSMVKNIATGATNSSPTSLININGTLFFAATDGVNGIELWKSDGTSAGTVMVKNIASGASSSSPTSLVNVGGTLVFTATDGTNGTQVWSSDGTDAGTVMLDKIGTGDASPGSYYVWNGRLYFAATRAAEGRELWALNGTDVTPPRVTSITRSGTDPTGLSSVNFSVVFSESVTGVDASDFALDVAGLSGNSITGVTGSGTTWTVTVDTGTGEGSLSIDLIDNDTILDTSGNYLGGYGAGNGNLTTGEAFAIDRIPPTMTIGAPSIASTRSGPVNFTVTYTGATAVTLQASDITLNPTGTATGTVTVLGSGTATRTVRVSGITGDGTLGISIAAGTAVDGVSNAAAGATSGTFTVDNTGPSVSIGAPSESLVRTGPVSYVVTYTGADAITLTSAQVQIVATGTANATASVSVAGSTSATVTLSSITGDGTLAISLPADTASDFLGNPALAVGPSQSFVVDNSGPVVTISLLDPNPTSLDTVRFGVSFDESVGTSFGLSAITVTGTLGGTAARSISGTDPNFVVTLTSADGAADGTLGLTVRNTVRDAAGNASAGGTSPEMYILDNTAPTGTITPSGASPTNADEVGYDIVFSESVGNTFSLLDISLSGSLALGAGAILTGSNATYHLALTPADPAAEGTLGVSITGAITDLAGNPVGAIDVPAVYTFDNTAPTLTISEPSELTTVNGPVTYTLDYSGAAGVDLIDSMITLHKTGTAKGTVAVSGSGTATRTVSITGITGTGTLAISVASGSAHDDAGNVAPAVGPSTAFNVQGLEIEMAVSAPSVSLTKSGPVTYQITYKNAQSTNLDATYVSLILTGTAAADIDVSAAGANVYTVTLNNATGDGTLGISVASGSAVDLEGQPAPAFASTVSVTVDNTPPVITLLGKAVENVLTASTYTDAGATASDSVAGDLTSAITTTSNVDTATPGTYEVSYDVVDTVGNAATTVKRTVVVSDELIPTVPLNLWPLAICLGAVGAYMVRRRSRIEESQK